jgi:hypothetical protein
LIIAENTNDGLQIKNKRNCSYARENFLRPERAAYANPPQRGGLAFPQQRRPVRATELFNEYGEYCYY